MTGGDETTMRMLAELLRFELANVVADPVLRATIDDQLARALALPPGTAARELRRVLSRTAHLQEWTAAQQQRGDIRSRLMSAAASEGVPARYLNSQHPVSARVGTQIPWEIWIGSTPLDNSAPCSAFAVPKEGAEVVLVVAGSAGLEPDERMHTVHVPEKADSERRLFLLRAVHPGTHVATVRAYVGGRPVGEQNIMIDVGQDANVDRQRWASAPIASVESALGHVTLQIDQAGAGYSCRLIHDGQAEAGFVSEIPHVLVEQLRRQLSHVLLGGLRRASPEMAAHDLHDLGLELWRQALPSDVGRQLRDLAGAAHSLSIVTDQHYDIPWELLPASPSSTDMLFMAERIPILRRLRGQAYPRVITVRNAAYVNPPSPLVDTGVEIQEVQAVLGDGVSHELPAFAHQAELVRFLDAGQFDLLHLACHNGGPRQGWQHVQMADGPFYCYNLNQAVDRRALRTRHPVVFFNACDSTGRPVNTQMSGWAGSFLDAGAGAFIGSTWAVRSDTARDFARAFYTALGGSGRTLGEASVNARGLIRDGNDPTWLAYAVYGSVETIVNWG